MLSEAFQQIKTAKKLPKISAQTQIELTAMSTGESEIVRVLSVSGAAEIDTCETEGGFSAGGKVTAYLVVQRADGSIGNEKASAPLHVRSSGSAAKAYAKANVMDMKVQTVSGDSVKLTMAVSVDFFATAETEVKFLSAGSANIFVKTNDIKTFGLLVTDAEDLSEDVNLECKFPVQKILSVSTDAFIKKISCEQNIAMLEGEIFAEVFALTDEETPRLITVSKNHSFRSQIAINGLCANCNLDGVLSIKSSEVSGEINGKDMAIICPMTFAYTALSPLVSASVSDLYSTEHIMDVKREKATFSVIQKREFFTGKIEGNISISNDQPRVDKFLATSGSSVSVLSANLSGDMLEVTGIAKTSVVYLNDEEGIINSVEAEIPFSIKQRMEAEENVKLHANAILSEVDITIKRGREIFFDAKLMVTATLWNEEFVPYVSEVSSLGAAPKSDAQIEIFFTASGQTFWDVAKKTYTNEDVLKRQNAHILEPFTGSERLVVYHQKKA